jgi:PAS domain S-box-containing protein
MRVGELARRTGVGVSTLRAWERRFGILEPARSTSGQRLYTEADVERVSAVCRLVAEGLTLSAAVGRIASAGTGAMSTGEGEAFLLHQVMQVADQGIWVTQDGHTRYGNRRMAELMRCSIDELMTRSVFSFVDPELLDTAREQGKRVRDGQRQRFEMQLRRADASSFLAEVSVTPLRDASGTFTGAVAVVSDVTARSQADSESRFRNALLDSIGETVLAARPDGTIVYANPAAERLFGWRITELIGQNGLELLPTPDGATSSLRMHSQLLTERRSTSELELTRRDGTHFVAHVTGSPVLDSNGDLVALISVLSDNSERRRLEDTVRTQEQQAETVALLGSRALRSTTNDENMVLTEVVEGIRRVLQSEHGFLLEVLPGRDELAMRASSPPMDTPPIMRSGSRSFAGYAALAAKVVVVTDASRDRRFDNVSEARYALTSAIAAPVFGPSGVGGVLIAASTQSHKFNESHAQFMQSMANVVGIALRPWANAPSN